MDQIMADITDASILEHMRQRQKKKVINYGADIPQASQILGSFLLTTDCSLAWTLVVTTFILLLTTN